MAVRTASAPSPTTVFDRSTTSSKVKANETSPDADRLGLVFAASDTLHTESGRTLSILGCLQTGGMSEIYVAVDQASGDEVVVKTPTRQGGDVALTWFVGREQKLPSSLRHPHIAAIIDRGTANRWPFLVMELVDGIDLDVWARRHLVQGNPPSWREACSLITQAARGLSAAHALGIVHRDIKPSNLILDSAGQVKVLDWGLVRFHHAEQINEIETNPDALLGTLDYMAPEQAADPRQANQQSDLYSLGCTFFYVLTGQAPFHQHSTAAAKVQAHFGAQRPAPRSCTKTIPRRIDRLVQRLMAVSPADRFPSTLAFLIAIERESARGLSGFVRRMAHGSRLYLSRKAIGIGKFTCAVFLMMIAFFVIDKSWHYLYPPPPRENAQTSTGTYIALPGGVRERHPKLIELILQTTDFDDEERSRWSERLDEMTAAERNALEARLLFLRSVSDQGQIEVPPVLRQRFPQLVKLILDTGSMTKNERRHWLAMLFTLEDFERNELQWTLERERDSIALLDSEYAATLNVGTHRDIAHYIRLAGSDHAGDRREAAIALMNRVKEARPAVSVLNKLLNDPDPQVALAARVALNRIHHGAEPGLTKNTSSKN